MNAAAFMHHDDQGHDPLRHYAILKVLNEIILTSFLNRLAFALTSWARDQETDVKLLFSNIVLSLNDMRCLLETTALPVSRL